MVALPKKKKIVSFIYLTLNWVFGVGLFLFGVVLTIAVPFSGLSFINISSGLYFIAMSVFLLPPVRKFAYSYIGKELPARVRVFSILALFAAFIVFGWQSNEQQLAVQMVSQQQEKIDYFNSNRSKIITSIKIALSAKDYKSALLLSRKYRSISDKIIEQMINEATSKLKKTPGAMQNAMDTEKILSEIENAKSNELEKIRDLYQELVYLSPNNDTYRPKVYFYEKKITKEKTEKLLLALDGTKTTELGKLKDIYQQLSNLYPGNETYISKLTFYKSETTKRESNTILAELEKTDAKEYGKIKKLYQRLIGLHPNNKEFQSKIDFYETKIRKRIQNEMKKKRKRIQNETKTILARLKRIPERELEKNRDLYQRLIKLNPNNVKYKKKEEYYIYKIVHRMRAKAKAKQRSGTRVIKNITISFGKCLEQIRATATNLGVAPDNIVETSILRMVRFRTNDGSGKSYLVTCSKLDQKLVINESW